MPVNVDQQFAEIVGIAAFDEVPEGLAFARQAAEHVLDGKGRDQLLVGFELRQIYYHVGVESYRAYADLRLSCPYQRFSGAVKLFYRDVQLCEWFGQLKGLGTGKSIAPRGGICDERFCAEVFQKSCRFDDY